MQVATALSAEKMVLDDARSTILAARIYHVGDTLTIDLKVLLPQSRAASVRDGAKAFQRRIAEALGEPIQLNLEVILVPMQRLVLY